jgi:hypothetical protein
VTPAACGLRSQAWHRRLLRGRQRQWSGEPLVYTAMQPGAAPALGVSRLAARNPRPGRWAHQPEAPMLCGVRKGFDVVRWARLS